MLDAYKHKYICRQEQPVAFPLHSMPEPDYVLAKKYKHRYRMRRPTADDIKVIIEVADSTLGRDHGSKNQLYAAYGVKEYWIINLIDYRLELLTEPTDIQGYSTKQYFIRGETFESLELGTVRVNDVLPKMAWEEE